MTNVLIPSDFSTASMKMAEQAVQLLNRQVNIIFFHAFEMPFYHQDLIRTERQPWQDLLHDDFRQGCRHLKTQYSWLINNISFKYMQGDSNALFRNWIEANEIDMIVCPADYVFTRVHSRSVNPVPLFRKSGLPLLQELNPVRKLVRGKKQEETQPEYSTAL